MSSAKKQRVALDITRIFVCGISLNLSKQELILLDGKPSLKYKALQLLFDIWNLFGVYAGLVSHSCKVGKLNKI